MYCPQFGAKKGSPYRVELINIIASESQVVNSSDSESSDFSGNENKYILTAVKTLIK